MSQQNITYEEVKHPEGILRILNAMETEIDAVRTLVNELRTDHATFKTAGDAVETLIEELHDDHATTKTAVDAIETLIEELHDDHATAKTCVDAIETLIEELHDDHATAKTLTDELKADFNLLRGELWSMCLGNAGLAEGTNANTIKTTNSVDYIIDGVFYTKAATDNIAMTALAVQAISTFCKYLVSIDSAGAVTLTKGTEVGTDASVLPAVPANQAVLGYINVATDGATTFTSGTTDLGAAGITDTYVNLAFANSGANLSSVIAATALATLTAAKPASGPATLTAAKPASGPATLTAAKPASDPATLTAPAVIDQTTKGT